MTPRRVAAERADEILDQIMGVIEVDGFADLKVSDLARHLKCSTATLYRIAPSKESLIVLAMQRWADAALLSMVEAAETATSPLERARLYYRESNRASRKFSETFRQDFMHFESTRRLYEQSATRFMDVFASYLEQAVQAEEIQPVSARLMALVFQQLTRVFTSQAALDRAGLTREEAVDEIEHLLWEGLLPRP